MEFQCFVASHSAAGHSSSSSFSLSPRGHQLIASGLLPLSVKLVSGYPGETGLLHLPVQPSLPHLLV